MAQNLLLRAAGLYSFPNHLSSVPQGALLKALNCIINRDNILESRRGFKIFGNAMSSGSSNTAHQIMTYKGRLLRHFGTNAGTTLEFDTDGFGTFDDFSGTFSELEEGLRIKGIEANSNFYFTTSDGIQKISASSADNLASTTIIPAGAAKGLDLTTELNSSPGFFAQESTVAYRMLWGYKDANANIILGTPSERSVIYNPLTPLLVSDFNDLLASLDTSNSPGGIDDGDYVSVLAISPTASTDTLRTALIALAAKIDADTIITEDTINTASASVSSLVASLVFNSDVSTFLEPGDTIVISALSGGGTTADLNGTHVISTVSTTTITFSTAHGDFGSTPDTGGVVQRLKYTLITEPTTLSDPATTDELNDMQLYYSEIVSDLQNEPVGITTSADYNTNDATTSQTVDLTFTIPESITTAYFYQLYRTQPTTSNGVLTLSSLDPGDECQLAFEGNPSPTDISNGYVTVTDITPDSFLGAYLETNPNTGDGILQANEIPPLAKDLALFKGYTFYANTQTKYRMNIALLSVADLTADQSTFTISDGITSNTYTFSTTENVGTKKVLISTADTPGQEVDETARSMERVINRDTNEIVYAYYLSGPNDVPGLLLLESRNIGQGKFYFTVDSDATGSQFNPQPSNVKNITSISMANPTVVTSTGHGLVDDDVIFISGSDSTPSIDGFRTVTKIDNDTFNVPVNVTVPGSYGGWVKVSDATVADNEIAPNRIYYSKFQQPEAVPILNYIEVGPKDKKILRVLALRDNLFLLKEEGVYRLSGLVAPFTVSLFDSSTNLKAPDSAVVLNNLIYCFTSQGITTISDTGVSIISRPIEDKLIKLASSEYTNFSTATFGMSYESDRTYYLWTVTNTVDEFATQCFRYNTFTNTWVDGDKAARSGIVNTTDDKAYIGPTDTNFIEQERKMFDRTDFADREISTTISTGSINGTSIILPSVAHVNIGDVLVQTQYLTIKKFNQLLTKLDSDTVLADTDYFSSLEVSTGVVLNQAIDALITKISVDSGRTAVPGFTLAATYTALLSTPTDFEDMQTTFNSLIVLLNNDVGVGYSNYLSSLGTVVQETVIESVNTISREIITQYAFPFIDGPALVFNHIICEVQWIPQSFQDVSMTKLVSESTLIFEDLSFSEAIFSFASDLSPAFESITFNGNGNGAYGLSIYGTGPYGGSGSGIPFRTYVPRDKARCRYLLTKFEHGVSREIFSLYGLSLTYAPTSQRGYR